MNNWEDDIQEIENQISLLVYHNTKEVVCLNPTRYQIA
jgi:hypothetical protein